MTVPWEAVIDHKALEEEGLVIEKNDEEDSPKRTVPTSK